MKESPAPSRKRNVEKDRAYQKNYYAKNKVAIGIRNRPAAASWARKQRRRTRDAALSALGGKCIRCGFADSRALQIDHVWGGGLAELRVFGQHQSGYYGRGGYLEHVIQEVHSGKYQLLCANCNWIKRSELREESGGRKQN